MIVEKAYVKDLNTAGGVRVGIEMKKVVVKPGSHAAGVYSNYPVVVLLTDLAILLVSNRIQRWI